MSDEIKDLLTKREETHGDAGRVYGLVYDLWEAVFLDIIVNGRKSEKATVVEQMMVQLKIARALAGNPAHKDNYIDQQGYSRLSQARECAGSSDFMAKNGNKRVVENWAVDEQTGKFLRNNHPEKTATNCRKHNET